MNQLDRKRAILLFAGMVTCAIATGCGPTTTGNLFYVWSGHACPTPVPPALNLGKAAGFTSREIAAQVAATETAGIHDFWEQKIKEYTRELSSPSGSLAPSPQATLVAELTQARAEKWLFRECVRIVRKGKPNHTLPY